jgi:uracil-DNA glycosylase
MEGPRSNRDPKIVAAKLGRLREDHIAPISALVDRIHVATRNQAVPYVDPTSGGVNARVLFLLETPAKTAALKSTMLSPDNNDTTAANVWELYRESGLPRDNAIHWNAVPWFMGTEKLNKGASRSDIVVGLPWLAEMVELLPRLRLVVTMGDIARRSFGLYLLMPEARLIPWLAVAHPSGRVQSAHSELWGDIRAAFDKAAALVREAGS